MLLAKTNKKLDGGASGGEVLTNEYYVLSLKPLGLCAADLELFEIGGVLDLIAEYVDQNTDKPKDAIATQDDFDNF